MSPRAVRQGFTDALDQNVKDYREKVTATKHDCIFETEMALRELEEERDRVTLEYRDAFETMRRCKERREAELTGLWKRDSERKWQLEAFRKRSAIADQKRRWQVKFFTKTGKPDKARKPGQPWDDSALAGPSITRFSWVVQILCSDAKERRLAGWEQIALLPPCSMRCIYNRL